MTSGFSAWKPDGGDFHLTLLNLLFSGDALCLAINLSFGFSNTFVSYLNWLMKCAFTIHTLLISARFQTSARDINILVKTDQLVLAYQWLVPEQWPLLGMWWTPWPRTLCAALHPPTLSAPWPSSRGPHSSTPQGSANDDLLSILKDKENSGQYMWHMLEK